MKMKRRAATVAASVGLAVALSAGAALAADIPGTPRGEVLRGTDSADNIWGYGGADLIYGFGGNDNVYGGNETGTGDRIEGGTGHDGLIGQRGHDALYGEAGSDRLDGQRGDDRLVGNAGEDVLNAGFGADRVNAQDGERDWIELCGSGASDVVYYDRGLDVFIPDCPQPASGNDALRGAGVGASEAAEVTEAELTTAKPPEGLFAHTGKVLLEHKGEELLVAEKVIGQHTRHGDEILDPTGRAEAE